MRRCVRQGTDPGRRVALARKRVAERVRKGGHDIPVETIDRRFRRGIHNLLHLYRGLCDLIVIYDNSTADPRLVATLSGSTTAVVRANVFRRILDVGGECR